VQSQYIKGWMNEGDSWYRGGQAGLPPVAGLTLPGFRSGPCLAVEGTNDAATLDRWYKTALAAKTLAEFRAAMPLDR
jgi:hypothetical protein